MPLTMMFGPDGAGNTLTVALAGAPLKLLAFDSVQVIVRVPDAPELNWIELVVPSADSTPLAPPALVMSVAEPSIAQAYVMPGRAGTEALYVLPAVAFPATAIFGVTGASRTVKLMTAGGLLRPVESVITSWA